MARHQTTTTESNSPPNPSPSDILGDTHIRRLLARIPDDQRNLLDRHESWAQYLSRRQKGFVNVPPEVLEHLKESYARQLQISQSDKSNEAGDAGISAGDNDLQPSGSQTSQIPHSDPGTEADNDEEDLDSRLSWAPSPEHHLKPPRLEESEEPEQLPFVTQLPEKSPLQPTIHSSPKHPRIVDFPSSSLGQEDELEVEVPTAINDTVMAINKPVQQIFATPPSAQIVPCTFLHSQTQSKTNPKQHIYKPVPALYRPPRDGSTSTHLNTAKGATKPDPTKPPFADTQSSLSTGDTSSSIIPSTNQDERADKRVPPWLAQAAPSPTAKTQTSPEHLENQEAPPESLRSPEYIPPSPQLRSSPPIPSITLPAPQPTTSSDMSSQAPFIRYTTTYPGYNGSIGDFVTACMYIQLQQRKLRTSLYDDFIRAWHEGYLPYIRNCDEAAPPRNALKAIDWYNEIDDDPVFTSRIVTRQNLHPTLSFYPDELRAARSLLGVPHSQTSETSQTQEVAQPPVAAQIMHAHTAAPKEAQTMQAPTTMPKPQVPVREPRIAVTRVSPPTFRRPEGSRISPLSKSFGEIEKRPVRAKGLTRSFSEAASHKRKASVELSGTLPKRVSTGTGLVGRSDSPGRASLHSDRSKGTARGSIAPSATSENRRKYADDPEMRSRKFAQFLKKRKWEKDSITSSAPVSNTPTSGQKQ